MTFISYSIHVMIHELDFSLIYISTSFSRRSFKPLITLGSLGVYYRRAPLYFFLKLFERKRTRGLLSLFSPFQYRFPLIPPWVRRCSDSPRSAPGVPPESTFGPNLFATSLSSFFRKRQSAMKTKKFALCDGVRLLGTHPPSSPILLRTLAVYSPLQQESSPVLCML